MNDERPHPRFSSSLIAHLSSLVFLMYRQGNNKRRPFTGAAVGVDLSAMSLGNFAADRKADAGSFIFRARVESLEHGEDPLGVLFLEADAVVRDGQLAEAL